MSALSASDALYASRDLSEQANRLFCSTCGYPLAGAKCEVCGGSGAPIGLEDSRWTPTVRKAAGTHPELDWAFEAWSKQDYARLVTHCLAVEGVRNARTFNLADGPAFIAVVRSTSVLIALRPPSDTLVIEAPVGKLPNLQRVPAMRVALELSHGEEHAVRLCVRKDWMLARFVGRLSGAEPTALLRSLAELCRTTHRCAALMAASFDAQAVSDADHATFSWDTIPKPRKLGSLAPAAPAAAESKKPSTKQPVSSGQGMFDSVPSILGQDEDEGAPTLVRMDPTPPPVEVAKAAMRGKVAERSSSSGSIPAVLAPSQRIPAMPHTSPSPGVRAAAAPSAPPAAAAAQAAVISSPPPPPVSAPPPAPATPAEAFCEMLSGARQLANTMTYEQHSATLMLLLRATVYRSVYEYTDTMPQAVAHLFHATSSMMREIWLTAPGKRRGSMQIPRPESALTVLDDIVAKQGAFTGQPPVKILPMTSAQQAKEHLARYVSEIDLAPEDAALRHHIALGALSELLVRTKLPGPTQQKLRGIVAHAVKEGPKPASLELILTALKRIIG